MFRNVGGVGLGLLVGGAVNMAIIVGSPYVIPPPPGADMETMEGLAAAMSSFQPKHFIGPFLAHALGTFAGTYVAAVVCASHQLELSLVVGSAFFAGGAIMVSQLPSPMWFNCTDLLFAYFPMSLLAFNLVSASGFSKKSV